MSYNSNKTNWNEKASVIINNSKIEVVNIDIKKRNINYSNKIKQHRTITSITGDEEIVRAFLINRFVNELDYKPELIEIEKEYEMGRPKIQKSRIDMILRDSQNKPFFFY